MIEPSGAGYLFIGASSGPWPLPVALPRARRRALLSLLHAGAEQLRSPAGREAGVERADVFRAVLRPPGRGRPFARRTADRAGDAGGGDLLDAVLLVQTRDPSTAAARLRSDAIGDLRRRLEAAGAATVVFTGSNVRRIGDVEHDRRGIFLFNYFSAEDTEENLHAWQYTAGWFQEQTGLDNSTVLQPAGPAGGYSLINHCRWEHLRDVLPALVLEPSFRRFVLRTFADHRTAANPVLYRLDG
ncbi:hypothetical protein [Kineococcus aurantiacus]|uniref:Uncharacterized protein n=1 Tax=Kineococcus aurantiacus TaxID=37633 RepID=A0A7Y9DQI2_9ACTN|nr:hypothetical protein [Kineococcus aurantiacus]NYD24869.1 hypothetical protein [Kineococcus aurantiacus]